MNYKEKLEEIKALVFGEQKPKEEPKEEAVEMASEDEKMEEPKQEAAPQPQFVSLSEFEAYKSEMRDAFAQLLELFAQNDKNTVPAELSKEKEEEKVEEKIELSENEVEAEVIKHDPDNLEKESNGLKWGQNRGTSTRDRVFQSMFGN